MLQDKTPAELRAALEWLVRLNDERASPDLRHKFEAWLGAAPEHRSAWNEANALWSTLDPVKAELDTIRRRDRLLDRRRMLGGLAATAVLGSGYWHISRPWFGADYTTAAGQTQDITLADGTLVNLGSRSAIGLSFGPERRGVQLLRGEAFFSVAADHRPFTVSALGGSIRARDSRFNVNLATRHVSVAVSEHEASVEAAGFPARDLAAGWSAVYDQQHLYPAVQVDPETIGAWRQGRLIFRNAPLGDVLAEIECWRGGRITIWSASAAAIPVTAIFDAKDPDMALDTIVQTLGLSMVDLPGGITFIQAG